MIHNLNDWIVVMIRDRIVVAGQVARYEHFLTLLELENKHLLHQADFAEDAFDVEDVDEAADSDHEPDLRELFLDDSPDHFVMEFGLGRPLIIHLHSVNFDIGKDVHAFRLVKEAKAALQILHIGLLINHLPRLCRLLVMLKSSQFLPVKRPALGLC